MSAADGGTPTAGAAVGSAMRATVRPRYCSLGSLSTSDVRAPAVRPTDVLVRVRAASVNRADLYSVRGIPLVSRAFTGLLRPNSPLLGTDFAGTVEAVGRDVRAFNPGDDVFGAAHGAFAEYVAAGAGIVQKPAGVSFEEAAAIPVAGLTALQALRDHGGVQHGMRVLVNGASGGVGSYAVQIAVALGADVTAVCSTPNVKSARDNGAAHVIDYRRQDFAMSDARYDVLVDIAGTRSWRHLERVLEPNGTVVAVGSQRGGPILGPASHSLRLKIGSVRSSQTVAFFVTKINAGDLDVLRELLAAGRLKPLIQARYDDLDQVADALRCLATGHVRGKIVVTVPASAALPQGLDRRQS